MAERPIICSGASVRAILDDKKTNMRRLVKPQPKFPFGVARIVLVPDPFHDDALQGTPAAGMGRKGPREMQWHCEDFAGNLVARWCGKCPYGVPGDLLWVRETWRIGAWDENCGEICVDYRADNFSRKEWLQIPESDAVGNSEMFERFWYQSCDDATKAGIEPDENGQYDWDAGASPCRWRPSIHMPKVACRLWLKVKAVRVERVQEISGEDAIAEGWPRHLDPFPLVNAPDKAQQWFRRLWDSLNAKRGRSFESNPWTWVVEFERTAH